MEMPVNHLLFSHDDCLLHDPGVGHPEQATRLVAVLKALDSSQFSILQRRSAPIAEINDLRRAHSEAHINKVRSAIPLVGHWNLDAETVISSGSWNAALRAAGAVCAAVDAVCTGQAETAFCAVRPPGHHAEADYTTGFCLFNNLAVGARRAQSVYRTERIAILDFDAHHGNGLQNIFWDDPNVLFISSHRWPTDLITGSQDECGTHNNILNVPLSPGSESRSFREITRDRILPALRDFSPDLLMVAAGFDGHQADPLCDLNLKTDDYNWIAVQLRQFATTFCDGRMISSLEGGYDTEALAECVSAYMQGTLDYTSL